ncbi:MAG: hypothetical protein INR72_06550 [Williamsia herbipolensis]|nr:hypothetical protein [Williamsia herbipolensis]
MDERVQRWASALAHPVLRGVGFLVLMLVVFTTLHSLGLWYPNRMADYETTAVICAVVIAVGRRAPLPLLLGVAIVVGWPLWGFQVGEVRAIPLALAAFLAAAGGLRLGVALPLAGLSALASQFPSWSTYLPQPGSWKWFVLTSDLSTRLLVFGIVVAAVLLGRASFTQRRDAEVLRARNEELERLRESDRVRIANEERTAIAREIHDVVAHHVAAIVIRAQAAARVADRDRDAPRAAVEWIAESGQEALAEMRGVVRVLRGADAGGTTEAPMQLAGSIDAVVDRIRQAGLAVRADVAVPKGLSAVQEFAVLRVCQEALTNVLIHSEAATVDLSLGAVGTDVVLVVEDDGSAAVPGDVRPGAVGRSGVVGSGGSGLRGMRERAEAAGGHVVAGPTERGWRVELVVPVPARTRDDAALVRQEGTA